MLKRSVPLGHSNSGKTYHVNLIPHSTMSASAFFDYFIVIVKSRGKRRGIEGGKDGSERLLTSGFTSCDIASVKPSTAHLLAQ